MIRYTQRTNTRRRRLCCIFACFLIASGLPIISVIFQSTRSRICVSNTISNNTVDYQDGWQYQNSITGEWYYWSTEQQNSSNNVESSVNWLNVAPTSYLGVIVYLTTINEIESLRTSLTQLARLLSNNPRPVVIFHEGDFNNENIQKSLAEILGDRTPLSFQSIRFGKSLHKTRSIHSRWSTKYLHMCRFFTIMLPNHPLISLFSFYWRLDSHSYIFGEKPIEDPFEIMQKRQSQYAFIMVNEEADHFATGLFELFQEFLYQHCMKLSPSFRHTQTRIFGRYSYAIFFTNFAIVNVSLFHDHPLMRHWLRVVDRNGGIYRERWGDAPIHTLALTQFTSRDDIVQLRYFGYFHRQEYTCAKGIQQDSCIQQVKPFLSNNTKIRYRIYPDGCYPSTRNSLCQYYPEIT